MSDPTSPSSDDSWANGPFIYDYRWATFQPQMMPMPGQGGPSGLGGPFGQGGNFGQVPPLPTRAPDQGMAEIAEDPRPPQRPPTSLGPWHSISERHHYYKRRENRGKCKAKLKRIRQTEEYEARVRARAARNAFRVQNGLQPRPPRPAPGYPTLGSSVRQYLDAQISWARNTQAGERINMVDRIIRNDQYLAPHILRRGAFRQATFRFDNGPSYQLPSHHLHPPHDNGPPHQLAPHHMHHGPTRFDNGQFPFNHTPLPQPPRFDTGPFHQMPSNHMPHPQTPRFDNGPPNQYQSPLHHMYQHQPPQQLFPNPDLARAPGDAGYPNAHVFHPQMPIEIQWQAFLAFLHHLHLLSGGQHNGQIQPQSQPGELLHMGPNHHPREGDQFYGAFYPQGQSGRPPHMAPAQQFQPPFQHPQGRGEFNGVFVPQGDPVRPPHMGLNYQPQGGGHFDRPFHPQGQPDRPPYSGPGQPFQAPMYYTQGGRHLNGPFQPGQPPYRGPNQPVQAAFHHPLGGRHLSGPFHPQGQPGRPPHMGPNQPVQHQDQPGPVQPLNRADDSSQDTDFKSRHSTCDGRQVVSADILIQNLIARILPPNLQADGPSVQNPFQLDPANPLRVIGRDRPLSPGGSRPYSNEQVIRTWIEGLPDAVPARYREQLAQRSRETQWGFMGWQGQWTEVIRTRAASPRNLAHENRGFNRSFHTRYPWERGSFRYDPGADMWSRRYQNNHGRARRQRRELGQELEQMRRQARNERAFKTPPPVYIRPPDYDLESLYDPTHSGSSGSHDSEYEDEEEEEDPVDSEWDEESLVSKDKARSDIGPSRPNKASSVRKRSSSASFVGAYI